jgi:hypothetical protein
MKMISSTSITSMNGTDFTDVVATPAVGIHCGHGLPFSG